MEHQQRRVHARTELGRLPEAARIVGLLGNDKVSASDGFASITTGNGASGIFGSMGTGIGTPVTGFYDNSFFSWLRWEKVAETNVGLSYQTLNGRLSAELDWFYRLTTEAVISPSTPIFGNALAGNWGKILNTGVDISVNWNDRVGDFNTTSEPTSPLSTTV